MRRPWRLLGVLGTALVLLFNITPVASFLMGLEDMLSWLLMSGIVAVIDLLWLWTRRGRTMHVTLDANILDVRASPLGAHYRIPLHDIKSIRITDIKTSRRQMVVILPEDQIAIGTAFAASELTWLASVARAAIKEARLRPAQREGMPDEIPRQLAALQSRSGE